METKVCTICKQEKDISHFHFRKDNGKYREQCIECRKEQNKIYRIKNQDKIKTRNKKKYAENAEEQKIKLKEYYKLNSDKIKVRTLEYYKKNKTKIGEARRKYTKERLKIDPLFKITRNLRNRLWVCLNRNDWKKDTNFAKYIGLKDQNELKTYIESLFEPGMTWENYGKTFHIDHIVPLNGAKTEEELYKLYHYTNLRPLWSKDNIVKGHKFDFKELTYIQPIDYKTAQDYVIKNHYLHRKSNFRYAFGLFIKANNKLVGVCIFGHTYHKQLRDMICGAEYSNQVIELTRLCIDDTMPKNTASYFVSKCLKRTEIKEKIIISFADTSQNHTGVIYQATNFIYTGKTRPVKEYAITGIDKHNISISKSTTVAQLKEKYGDRFHYVTRSIKHRYIYFRDKTLIQHLKIPTLPYPKP